jgi:hypothetical protein
MLRPAARAAVAVEGSGMPEDIVRAYDAAVHL